MACQRQHMYRQFKHSRHCNHSPDVDYLIFACAFAWVNTDGELVPELAARRIRFPTAACTASSMSATGIGVLDALRLVADFAAFFFTADAPSRQRRAGSLCCRVCITCCNWRSRDGFRQSRKDAWSCAHAIGIVADSWLDVSRVDSLLCGPAHAGETLMA
eukprot:6187740-Pleurochrysis_carterae.AAC.1